MKSQTKKVTALSVQTQQNGSHGKYSWQAQNEHGVTEQGTFIILQNFALADSIDYKSYWQAVLDAIDAMMAGRATQAQQEVRVDGKYLKYLTVDELLKLRDFVLQKVAEEREEEGDEADLRLPWRQE